MRTEALLERLSDDLEPVRPGAGLRILTFGLGSGVLASLAIMLLWLGVRPDLMPAMATSAYWMKFLYTLALASCGVWLIARLARPGRDATAPALLEILPPIIIASLALLQWRAAPAADHMHLLMGGSHTVCPWRIVILALPIFAGLFWSLRRLAPTRPMLSGAAAGLAAGAAGAFIYAMHCDESAMPFVAVWYTAGMALPALLGAGLGRWALRW